MKESSQTDRQDGDANGILLMLLDDKERPIFVARANGQASFYRYADMPQDQKDALVSLYNDLAQEPAQSCPVGDGEPFDIREYLDYKNDLDVCG